MICSRRSPSTAPATSSVEPSEFTSTSAGWYEIPKRSNTSPGSSLICGNVSPWRSTKSWKSSSLPVQATPTKSTESANCAAASSTEGASRLQMLQVGAQNQNAVGAPATDAPSKVPPPRSGALNCRMSGTATGSVGAGASVGGAAVSPGVAVESGVWVVSVGGAVGAAAVESAAAASAELVSVELVSAEVVSADSSD